MSPILCATFIFVGLPQASVVQTEPYVFKYLGLLLLDGGRLRTRHRIETNLERLDVCRTQADFVCFTVFELIRTSAGSIKALIGEAGPSDVRVT